MGIINSVANAITGGRLSLLETVASATELDNRQLRERASDQQEEMLGRAGEGWTALGGDNKTRWTRDELRKQHAHALAMYWHNPFIRRVVDVKTSYILGQGVTISSPQAAVNQVIQEFLDAKSNQRALTGPSMMRKRSRELLIFGSVIPCLFVNPAYGRVKVSVFDLDEIGFPLCDPDDGDTPWLWPRTFTRRSLESQAGHAMEERVTEYHPDWGYNPASKPATFGGHTIRWDRPVFRIAADGVGGSHIAPSPLLCVVEWGRVYTKFLEHRFSVAAALSKWVHKIATATKKGAQAAAKKVETSFVGKGGVSAAPPGVASGLAAPAGGVAVTGGEHNIEAMQVKGATIHPDEGRRFLLAVGAGAGLPETFFGDVSVGSLATAESLDQPTALMMAEGQSTWGAPLKDLVMFALIQAARAPLNPFSKVARVKYIGATVVVEVKNEKGAFEPVVIDVDFPEIVEPNVKDRVEAISAAAPLIKKLPKTLARMVLVALKQNNIDELLKHVDEDGTELPDSAPTAPPLPADPGEGKPAGAPPKPPKKPAKTA